MEVTVNGNMGIACTVQRFSTVSKNGVANPPKLARQTDCFEKRNGEWVVIHEHTSFPAGGGWDGVIVRE
jgi:ketosteroid isomerase-like protein